MELKSNNSVPQNKNTKHPYTSNNNAIQQHIFFQKQTHKTAEHFTSINLCTLCRQQSIPIIIMRPCSIFNYNV